MRTNNAVVKKDTPSPALPGILSLQGRGKQVVPFASLREKVGGARMRGHLHGFTLIELLVVVLIIGILAAIAVPQYKMAVLKARISPYLATANSIYQTEETYYLNNAQYTTNPAQLDIDIPSECTLLYGTSGQTSSVIYKCSDSIALQFSEDGVVVNYCPQFTTWPDCQNKRELNLAYYFIHGNHPYKGTRKCHSFADSSLAAQFCKQLGFWQN